jgi:hypothetical protein
MARLLYDFLPGAGKPEWKGHVSFQSISKKLGLAHYWQEGSKEPAIRALLERTLEREPHLFEKLILEIVAAGITYCKKNKKPITPTHIETLNGHILELGLKIPALWERDFLESLETDGATRARKIVEAELRSEQVKISKVSEREQKREELKLVFYQMNSDSDRQGVGFKLEKLLDELFEMFQLSPRSSFKLIGEQIDGSFQLDAETYLVEAKWEKDRLAEGKLLIFRGKVEGKSQFTRGAFIAINGFTEQCQQAIVTGKQPNFFLVDGYDLTMVLEGQVGLDDLLRAKMRRLAEEGIVMYRLQRHK